LLLAGRLGMTREDAISSAEECSRQASAETDSDLQAVWRGLSRLWLSLARFGDDLGENFDTEYERIAGIQLSVQNASQKALH
jgi:hypothetical protein